MKTVWIPSLAWLVVGCGGSVGSPRGGSDLSVGDASTGDASTDTGASVTPACAPVLASDYDQSCAADTDCTLVGQVPSCPAAACDGCLLEAISTGEVSRYKSAFAQAVANAPPGACNCPCEGIAICRAGKCKAGFCGPTRADTLPACADAGGTCLYAASTTCARNGPPGSCAFDDEVCCL